MVKRNVEKPVESSNESQDPTVLSNSRCGFLRKSATGILAVSGVASAVTTVSGEPTEPNRDVETADYGEPGFDNYIVVEAISDRCEYELYTTGDIIAGDVAGDTDYIGDNYVQGGDYGQKPRQRSG